MGYHVKYSSRYILMEVNFKVKNEAIAFKGVTDGGIFRN